MWGRRSTDNGINAILKLPCRRVDTKENENLAILEVPLCVLVGIGYFERTIPNTKEGVPWILEDVALMFTRKQ